jgi:hypothetical protein
MKLTCEREVVYLDNFGKCVGFVYRDARVGLPADVVADGGGDDERDG